MNGVRPGSGKPGAEEVKRTRHTIRFYGAEWDRVEAFAETRGLPAAEFVRFATLAAIEDKGDSNSRLAPLIETTFRATYILATRLRHEMLDAGEQEELDALVALARDIQKRLLDGDSD